MLRALSAASLLVVACSSGSVSPAPAPQTAATPTALGFDSLRLDLVRAYLATQVDSAFPGAVIAVGRHGQLALLAAVGHYGSDDPRPVTPTTIYDLASLTKVVGLTTACMLLVDQGALDLDAPVQRYVPAFRGAGKERVTIRHLLTHSSGLPAWRPLYKEAPTRDAAIALVDTTALLRQPGDTFVYSDLGAIVLTQAVEAITGERIDRYLAAHLFGPLGMTSTRYLPPAGWRGRIAPTEDDTAFRHRMLRGEVHDENTGRLEGISGHAGLFSTAPDLARFTEWLLENARNTEHGAGSGTSRCTPEVQPSTTRPAPCSLLPISDRIVRAFVTRQNLPPGSSRALGWDTPSENSSAGTKLSARAFGHTGFTGTSIWMDPDQDLFIILLTNRVHPTRANTRIYAVRRRVANLVVDALGP